MKALSFKVMFLFFTLTVTISSTQSQNLIKNGDFEYPITDELSLKINTSDQLQGWEFQYPVSVINHIRLFPYFNFQSLLIPALNMEKSTISQKFVVDKSGMVEISFAIAASRIENGRLRLTIDGKEIFLKKYTELWTPSETKFTDHMKWIEFKIPGIKLDEGNHTIQFVQDSCRIIADNQGDKRDMIEGFLIDKVEVNMTQETMFSGIPGLDDLAGQIIETKTLACYPTVSNFLGSVKSSKCLGGFDPSFFYGGKLPQTAGLLKIGEEVVFSDKSQWFPYQIVNKSNFKNIDFTNTMRLVFEKQGILMSYTLENNSDQSVEFPLTMELIQAAAISKTSTDKSIVGLEYSGNQYVFAFVNTPDSIITRENEVIWNISLLPGEKRSISYVLGINSDLAKAMEESVRWAKDYEATFISAKTMWESRWKDVFTPGNVSYSGYLPTFETSDKNLYELYYLSIVSFLETQQNNLYPTLKIAFGSNNEWARNQAYFWEISQFADMYALLDPKGMKTLIEMSLKVDISKGNALDYNTGKIVNHWYAVNDYALFKTIDSYVRINRDFDFLKSNFNGISVLENLYLLSTNWEKKFSKEIGLADYGKDPWSFFETNPDYIHFVPAMNAQNVWMMRNMAVYDKLYGKGNRSKALIEKADYLANKVKSLYVPGSGVWKVMYPDGRSIVSRHSYDFLTIGMTMTTDISPEMKNEMIAFVENELLTETHFMRAMSLKDSAAKNTDRSDHGPAGCYIGWPALTVQAIADLGEFEKAASILANFRGAFVESGMGQALEFLVPVGSSEYTNRTGARAGAYFLLSGSDYANTIIDGLMGYKPSIDGNLNLSLPQQNRFFDGRLINLRHGGKNYSLLAGKNGVMKF